MRIILPPYVFEELQCSSRIKASIPPGISPWPEMTDEGPMTHLNSTNRVVTTLRSGSLAYRWNPAMTIGQVNLHVSARHTA